MTPEPVDTAHNLDRKLVGGVAWTAGAKWATQAITWGSLVLTAHLLTRADYGVGQMVGTLAGLSNVLAEFGVGTAVLHMPELNRKSLAQLHLFSCMLCGGMFILATLASPFVARFYHSQHVTFFMANNVALFITGFQAVPMGLLARDMDYRRLSLAEAAMVVAQSVVMVITAWMGWGYWALFAGGLAGKGTSAIMVCSWKHVGFAWPRWKDIRAPVELGRQAAVGRMAWALYTLSDGIVVGRMFGEEVLGTYQMAMNLATAPAEKVSLLLMRTATPLFANIQTDRSLIRRYYLILIEILSLVVMPVMLGLAIVSPLAVPMIFGAKWQTSVGPLQWLSLFMILRSLGTLTEQILISQRMTRFTMRMSIFNFVIMPVAFIVAARTYGTTGVAASWVALSPLTIVPLAIILLRHIELPYRRYFSALLPALAGSAVMVAAVLGVRYLLRASAWSPTVMLGTLVATGAAAYAIVVLGFFRERVMRYVRFLMGLRKGNAGTVAAIPG